MKKKEVCEETHFVLACPLIYELYITASFVIFIVSTYSLFSIKTCALPYTYFV